MERYHFHESATSVQTISAYDKHRYQSADWHHHANHTAAAHSSGHTAAVRITATADYSQSRLVRQLELTPAESASLQQTEHTNSASWRTTRQTSHCTEYAVAWCW